MDQLQRFRLPLILALAAVAGIVVYSLLRPAPATPLITVTLRPSPVSESAIETQATPEAPQAIQVYVSGAVKKPDVYSLPAGSIVKDALNIAGGPAEDADLDRINLAARLSDGMQVRFPRQGEPAAPVAPGEVGPSAVGPIDLNTATLEQLDSLPGIGPSIAQRIIDYREANGPFTSIEQIKNVKGIGDALFEKIKDQIVVGP